MVVSLEDIKHLPIDLRVRNKKSLIIKRFDFAEIEFNFFCDYEKKEMILIPEGERHEYYICARIPIKGEHIIFGLPCNEAINYEKDGNYLCLVKPEEINIKYISRYNVLESSFKH